MKKGCFARKVKLENLDEYKALLRSQNETSKTSGDGGSSSDPEVEKAERKFSGESINVKPPFIPTHLSHSKNPAKKKKGKTGTQATSAPAPVMSGRTLLWRKKLSQSDAQQQTGHPTGTLRLNQARFKDQSGNLIDQKTYFKTLFNNSNWQTSASNQNKSTIDIDFEVNILGNPYGVRKLTLSHDPTRVAGQNNVPTWIHWGPIQNLVKSLNLSGKTFELYGPLPGNTAPYLIVIS